MIVSGPNSLIVHAVVVVVMVSFTAVCATVKFAVISVRPKRAAPVSMRLFCFIVIIIGPASGDGCIQKSFIFAHRYIVVSRRPAIGGKPTSECNLEHFDPSVFALRKLPTPCGTRKFSRHPCLGALYRRARRNVIAARSSSNTSPPDRCTNFAIRRGINGALPSISAKLSAIVSPVNRSPVIVFRLNSPSV